MFQIDCVEGRLTADPVLAKTTTGKTYAYFNIATDRDYKTVDGKKITDFNHVVVWGKTASFVHKNFKKASTVIVVGRFESYDKIDDEGKKLRSTSLNAHRVYLISNYQSTPYDQMGQAKETSE